MAKGKKRRGHGGRKRRSRAQKAVLSISASLWILFLLQRMGILTRPFWDCAMRGDIGGAIDAMYSAMNSNFYTAGGVTVTLTGAVALAIVTMAIKLCAKKGSIPLKMPKRISA